VAAVKAGSPADGALRGGDVITAIDGTAVHSSDEAVAAIGTHQPGDSVTVTVRRGGGTSDVKVTLGTRS
jgi:S1-C subfamily serine protease